MFLSRFLASVSAFVESLVYVQDIGKVSIQPTVLTAGNHNFMTHTEEFMQPHKNLKKLNGQISLRFVQRRRFYCQYFSWKSNKIQPKHKHAFFSNTPVIQRLYLLLVIIMHLFHLYFTRSRTFLIYQLVLSLFWAMSIFNCWFHIWFAFQKLHWNITNKTKIKMLKFKRGISF